MKTNKQLIQIILIAIIILIILFTMTGCASWDRGMKSLGSNFSGGLDRTVNVYSYTGEKLATHEGKIDLQENEGKVLFDLNGKRYIYYNAVVEVIEK